MNLKVKKMERENADILHVNTTQYHPLKCLNKTHKLRSQVAFFKTRMMLHCPCLYRRRSTNVTQPASGHIHTLMIFTFSQWASKECSRVHIQQPKKPSVIISASRLKVRNTTMHYLPDWLFVEALSASTLKQSWKRWSIRFRSLAWSPVLPFRMEQPHSTLSFQETRSRARAGVRTCLAAVSWP